MAIQHRELAAGRWFTLTLAEQLGNAGSEVHRMAVAKSEDDRNAAFVRALELIDLTIADSRHRKRLKEITRLREFLCDAAAGGNGYRMKIEDLDQYLMTFAIAARARISEKRSKNVPNQAGKI